jgi:exonuclease SbcC
VRILAIRGENLASLYGKFELRLDRAPIAGAGIFSIAGPTGSGKSTLLDALCLALYGKTPRLRDRAAGKRVMVGWSEEGETLDMNDVRALVSRGTAGASAEVEYQGIDGRRYLARWRVRRARDRVEGAFQAQAMTVEDLDSGEVLAEKVTQAVARNEAAIGFTFDELKRAVVPPKALAPYQNVSDADVRAAILERVTGTAIYGRLSQAAHQRLGRERAARERLRQLSGAPATGASAPAARPPAEAAP